MNEFTQLVIKIIKEIPKGEILSFGDIAKMAGRPRSARQIAWILPSLSHKHELPSHRIINANGKISLKGMLEPYNKNYSKMKEFYSTLLVKSFPKP